MTTTLSLDHVYIITENAKNFTENYFSHMDCKTNIGNLIFKLFFSYLNRPTEQPLLCEVANSIHS